MNPNYKLFLYTVSGVFFLISFVGMLIYGYKTFFIAEEQVESKNYTYHFALIAEENENDYWRLIERGAKKAASEYDIYLEYAAPQKADNDEMLKLLDRVISPKLDGIITQGIEGERFVDLVHKGIERGIPIVTVDSDVKSSEREVYVGTDNVFAGQLLGEALIKDSTGEQYVGVITGRFDAINQQERVQGFRQVVESDPRIHIVEIKESDITQVGATQATYSLLKEYPSINAIIGTSALDGYGIVEGVREIAPYKDFYIATFDILPETLTLLREEQIDATIAQYPEEMGFKAIEVMMELQTKELLENQLFTDTKIVRKQDLKEIQNGVIQ